MANMNLDKERLRGLVEVEKDLATGRLRRINYRRKCGERVESLPQCCCTKLLNPCR